MSDASSQRSGTASPAEIQAALFAQLVMQQANMAFMLLGRIPDPGTGETHHDVEAAKLFIDQLEMLEVKTKGNLNPQETALLQQSLTALRLAYVEAMKTPTPKTAPAK